MSDSARLFLCARCRTQVVVCSDCDRGQSYCGPMCSGLARHAAQREAARRYQGSRRGRITHAARSRRWRGRQDAKIVTHHGSLVDAVDAPLAA